MYIRMTILERMNLGSVFPAWELTVDEMAFSLQIRIERNLFPSDLCTSWIQAGSFETF